MLSNGEKLRIRLVRENLKRVVVFSSILGFLLPILALFLWNFGENNEVRKAYLGFLLTFEVITIAFLVLGSYSKRKKDYVIAPIIYRSFWSFSLLFIYASSYISLFESNNIGIYCVLISVAALVPLLNLKEFLYFAATQMIFFSFVLFQLELSFASKLSMIIYSGALLCISRFLYSQYRKMLKMQQKLQSMAKNAEEDPLTGLLNRRGLDRNLEVLLPYCIRSGIRIGLMIVDVDNFKRYNDSFGHPQGDKCLKMVAAEIRKTARRSSDLTARIGGEEFVILVYDEKESELISFAEKIRTNIENLNIKHSPTLGAAVVTVSIGVSSVVPTTMQCMSELYKSADQSLYTAKKSGRDVVVYKEKVCGKRNRMAE
ncbi:diguanylate cyclase [Lachnoclostridium phytofermentans ISDg]|uniref:Diguanylate cyclase n=2 Tax=Lachnoclostridium phytofermentans TaxID=66219 RepID=A9KJK3_LACP7|nr:diguanylate cyclase [Lachnoclostridium phytofermentans ISDg]